MSAFTKDKIICCTNCLKDAGFAYNASLLAKKTDDACPECGDIGACKLTKEQLSDAAYQFFVRGSFTRCEYGGYPFLQMNDSNEGDNFKPALACDIGLLRKHTNFRVFNYGPRFWMFGKIEPLEDLQKLKTRPKVIEEILRQYPEHKLKLGQSFYRIRVNPEKPEEHDQYDAPPKHIKGEGRFNRLGKPILYGSQDLELCIHETRASIEDSLYVATLTNLRELRLLDLSVVLPEDGTEFESLDLAVLFIFLAGSHSYTITREIANKVEDAGYDGIIYPSYFSSIRSGAESIETVYGISTRRVDKMREYEESKIIRNIALFGRSLEKRDVEVTCINTVTLTHVTYGAVLGPTGL